VQQQKQKQKQQQQQQQQHLQKVCEFLGFAVCS
jgi:hypothetical protein